MLLVGIKLTKLAKDLARSEFLTMGVSTVVSVAINRGIGFAQDLLIATFAEGFGKLG